MKIGTILIIIYLNIKLWLNNAIGRRFKLLPYKVLINLTDKCNSRCDYCDIWQVKNFDNEINLEDTLRVFDGMGSSLVWLSLSGGEITLVKYLDEMLAGARNKCQNLRLISFTTNGLLPAKVINITEKIKELGFEPMVTISLDGDEELHDRVRGVKGNYKKCMFLYESLKQAGVNVNYGITVNGENKAFIFRKYRDFKHAMKAVTFVHDGGIYKKENIVNKKDMITSLRYIFENYSIDALSEIIEYIHIKIAIHFLSDNMRANLVPCEVINTSIHVMPDGKVKPCMYMDELGDIKKSNISSIIFNNKTNKIIADIKEDKCPHCWMNCYSPYSIMQHPFKSVGYLFKRIT